MPRFTDEWVVTKSLFEYTVGGQCDCCTFPSLLFHPDGLKGLISSVSDLETDAADAEIKATESSPFPPEMREHIWADRVKVRFKMKKEMDSYKEFLQEVEGGEAGLIHWCTEELGSTALRRIFQMPRSEVEEILTNRYGICPAYVAIMKCVVDQVANFGITKYDNDGRGEEELAFEKMLTFNRRGGFMLGIVRNDAEIDEDTLFTFVSVMKTLGGPKLLQRGPKSSNRDEEDGGADEPMREVMNEGGGPSFRSDRRITRLIIARYWADQIISKYKASCAIENNGED
mmetsp:Transcript_4541/g.6659  ORF Transcript_4541/g.6659 Transcript_4541/m.6659 type:complete len:286 (-) Transcript_4541:67-924(-)